MKSCQNWRCLWFDLFFFWLNWTVASSYQVQNTYAHVCSGTRNYHSRVTCAARGASLACNSRWRAPALMLMVLRLSKASFLSFSFFFQALQDKSSIPNLPELQRVLCENVIRQNDCTKAPGHKRDSVRQEVGLRWKNCEVWWEVYWIKLQMMTTCY